MTKEERLRDAAFQQFDKCVDKYTLKIKNCLAGMIYHAYGKGKKDGQRSWLQEKKEEWNAAYRKGLEDMLLVMRDAILSKELNPNGFRADEMLEAFGGVAPKDFLLMDPEEIMRKADMIQANRECIEKDRTMNDTRKDALQALSCCMQKNCTDCPRHVVMPGMTFDYIGPCNDSKKIKVPESLCKDLLEISKEEKAL